MRARSLLLPCAVALLFSACADSVPQLADVEASVIFDYADEDSAPSVRFSVFAQVADGTRGAEQVQAVHAQTGLTWTARRPRRLSGLREERWAGYTNFVPASGQAVPTGRYRFVYRDGTGEQCEGEFLISYPEALPGSTAGSARGLLDAPVERLALYDAAGTLLYFGARKESWQDDEAILRDYAAATMRICYENQDGTVICMMPGTEFN